MKKIEVISEYSSIRKVPKNLNISDDNLFSHEYSKSFPSVNIIKANKNERGINLGAIPNKFNIEYLKYVETKYPFSTIKSKKLTALTVKAINESPNKIIKKFFMISVVKF